MPGVSIQIAADTHLRLDLAKRSLAVASGSVFLKPGAQEAWSFASEGLQATVRAGSAVELAVEPQTEVAIAVLEGSVEARAPGQQEPVHAGPKTRLTWAPKAKRVASAPLSPEDQKRLAARGAPQKPAQGLGQLVVRDAQSGSPVRLNVAQYHAHVVLHPPVALVQIDQSFYNPSDRQTEGTFVFNLPKGASVSRFAMYVDSLNLVEGELIERQRAAEVYDSIVRRQRDPAILEQIGDNLFRMRVFPILARDFKRILLDFTLPLESSDGQHHFELPLLSDLEPIWDFQVTGAIRGPTRLESVVSRSHPKLAFRPGGPDEIALEWKESDFRPQSDLSLDFVQPAATGPSLRSYTAAPLGMRPDLPGSPRANRPALYFLASLPPEPNRPAVQAAPADVVILADTSSEVRHRLAARQMVRMIVENLPPGSRVRIGCADVSCRWLHEGWTAAIGPEARQVLKQLERELWLGGLDLTAALAEALKAFPAEDSPRRRMVIYVGSGRDTLGKKSKPPPPGDLANRFAKAKVTLLAAPVEPKRTGTGTSQSPGLPPQTGIGSEPAAILSESERLLETVAEATGGLVLPAVRRQEREDWFTWLLAGFPSPTRVVDLAVEGDDEADLLSSPGWLPGRGLSVMGRTTATDRVRLRVTVRQDGKEAVRRFELNVDPRQDDVFLGRLWAQRKLDQLYTRVQSDGPFVREQILAIAQEWSLLTPYTAFLVLEDEAAYRRWNIDRRLRRRYWQPAEAMAQQSAPPRDFDLLRSRQAQLQAARADATAKARFDKNLRSARQALQAGNYQLAHGLLQEVRRLPWAAGSPEYAQLRRQAEAHVRQDDLLDALGPHRLLLVPPVRPEPERFQASVAPLLTGPSNPDFARRHPLAASLLKEIRVQPEKMSLERLVLLLRERTGLNVVVDRGALEESGVPYRPPAPRGRRAAQPNASADQGNPFDGSGKTAKKAPTAEERVESLAGWGRISIRSYARFVLGQQGLTAIEEPHRLLITTADRAGQRFRGEVYPVADLFLAGRVADLDQLADPYLDRQLAARERIRGKLRRPVTVRYENRPLGSVIQDVARQLDDNVLVDTKALEETGVDLDRPVTAAWHDVPLRESLRWTLDQLDLTYIIEDEAILITTPDRTDARLLVQLHSGRGIVLQPSPAEMERFRMQNSGMFGAGGGWFGGGMGGMGMGGMGGMGMGGRAASGQQPLAISVIPGLDASTEPVAAGAEGEEPPETARDLATDELAAPAVEPAPGVFPRSIAERRGRVRTEAPAPFDALPADFIDVDSVIDMVENTIQPDAWSDTGAGQGQIAFFAPTLDFATATTEDVHDQIEALFARLRQIPPAGGRQSNWVPAEISGLSPEAIDQADLDSLIDLIEYCIQPDHWAETGAGPGSIAPDGPRCALVVSATGEVHDSVASLFVLLRRSRYEALRGSRPWQVAEAHAGPWFGSWHPAPLWTGVSLARLPEPRPGRLQALAVRREPPAASCVWRRKLPGAAEIDRIGVSQSGGRMALDLPGRKVRITGDEAAIAYPELLLVEHGQWGESIRQWLDGRLPWMPHRTNAELARMFEIRTVPAAAGEKEPDSVRLRFALPGYADGDKTYFEAAFPRKHGLPVAWEAYSGGRLTQRLRFQELGAAGGMPQGRKVLLEDPAGKVLVEWELVEGGAPAAPLRGSTEGWEGYVQLDRRFEHPQVDAAFLRGLAAVRNHDWPSAFEGLKATLGTHPRQPLVLLLLAWCRERHESLAPREEFLGWLEDAASGQATGIVRFIAEGNFPSLRPRECYFILTRQPAHLRTAGDYERLARAALAADYPEMALEYAEAAVAASEGSAEVLRRDRLRIEVLLQLGQTEKASREASSRGALSSDLSAEVAELAALLGKHGLRDTADRLLDRALAQKDLTPEARRTLLNARARVQGGLARWRSLLSAIQLAPSTSPERARELERLLDELRTPADAAAAATLARETDDPRLRGRLLLREAELAIDTNLAADVAWQVHQMGQLPAERNAWACWLWNTANQPGRTIGRLEGKLRRGGTLDEFELSTLETAYREANRPIDAQRAATTIPSPPPRNPSRTETRAPGVGFM